jgi:ABC-type molybdate transport system substrate-binding protein
VSAVLALVLAMNLAVLCAGAASETVHQLAERYAQATGNTVSIVTGTAGQLRARLNAGERADVVILPAPGIADLERGGGLVAGTRTDLGRTGMGIGVRRGAPVPDLSSPEALKRVLLSARAIVATDPASGATAGIYFAKVLARLGIAEAVKPKLAVVPGGPACAAFAKGDADVRPEHQRDPPGRGRDLGRAVPRRTAEFHHLHGRRPGERAGTRSRPGADRLPHRTGTRHRVALRRIRERTALMTNGDEAPR